MTTAPPRRTKGRGPELLLAHCAALTRPDDAPPAAAARLEAQLGGRLSRLLVAALAPKRREQRLAA
jgi:hypothetical protein